MAEVFVRLQNGIQKYKKLLDKTKKTSDDKLADKMKMIAQRIRYLNSVKIINNNNFKEQLAIFEQNLDEMDIMFKKLEKILLLSDQSEYKGLKEAIDNFKGKVQLIIDGKNGLWDYDNGEYIDLSLGSPRDSPGHVPLSDAPNLKSDHMGELISAYKILLDDYTFYTNPEHYNSFGSILVDVNGNMMTNTITLFDDTISEINTKCANLNKKIDDALWLPSATGTNSTGLPYIDTLSIKMSSGDILKIQSMTDTYEMKIGKVAAQVEYASPANIMATGLLCNQIKDLIEIGPRETPGDTKQDRHIDKIVNLLGAVYTDGDIDDDGDDGEDDKRMDSDDVKRKILSDGAVQTTLKLSDVRTVTVEGSKFNVKNEDTDFNVMYSKKKYENTLFVFNDNVSQYEAFRDGNIITGCAEGKGNAVIRKYQCEEPRRVVGIPTNNGWTKMTPDIKSLINEAIVSLRKAVLDNPLVTNVIFSQSNTEETLGVDIFPNMGVDVKKYIFESILQLSPKDPSARLTSGGAYEGVKITDGEITDLSQFKLYTERVTLLKSKMDLLNKRMEEYGELMNKLNLRYFQKKSFVTFLIAILQSPKILDNIIHFKYINKGYIQFYLSAIKKIITKIDDNNKENDILYFKYYHYVTLRYLSDFLTYVKNGMEVTDVLDLGKRHGVESQLITGFLILNNFKDILEAHRNAFPNPVTIYARINDRAIDDMKPRKYFTGDDNDVNLFKIDTAPNSYKSDKTAVGGDDKMFDTYCGKEHNTLQPIKFTEVFDDKYESNAVLSKYMNLETQINKKEGVMLITYGYSGTGKTYTLFGKLERDSNTKEVTEKTFGILQATLAGIKDAEEVRFRLYELHGYGVAYPHYWKSNVNQVVYSYSIRASTEKLIIRNVVAKKNVDEYIKSQEDFTTISKIAMKNVFDTFSEFVEEVDKKRKTEGRICITPNNPESSRSIIIYEFNVLVGEKYIPFVIVDLPGREEIVQTYVDTYMNKPWMNGPNADNWKKIYDSPDVVYPRYRDIPNYSAIPFFRALLTSMTINPLALGILVPSAIFEGFNTLDKDDRSRIGRQFQLASFGLSGNNLPVSLLHQFSNTWDSDSKFIFSNTREALNKYTTSGKLWEYQDKIINIRGSECKSHDEFQSKLNGSNPIMHREDQIFSNINSIQYQGVIALMLINKMIVELEFGALGKIYEHIVNLYFKDITDHASIPDTLDHRDHSAHDIMIDILSKSDVSNIETGKLNSLRIIETGDNPDTLSSIITKKTKVKNMYNQIFNFRSYMTPFEGIYINENIMGLIKVLTKIVANGNDAVVSNLVKKQDTTLDFESKKYSIRMNNIALYSTADKATANYENIFRDDKVLRQMSDENSDREKGYVADKIFNYDKPFVQSIFDMYGKERSDKTIAGVPITIAAVKDYKIFYLFSNNDPEKKCAAQIRLLENTRSFINMIEK